MIPRLRWNRLLWALGLVWAVWVTHGQFRPKVEVTRVTMVTRVDKRTFIELAVQDGTQSRVVARYLGLPQFGRVNR